ncbi:MAG TPA: two-component regulator propeller domain-containing protein [Candidatus Eisenbacteria bacterium]|jgi:hypothetical protein
MKGNWLAVLPVLAMWAAPDAAVFAGGWTTYLKTQDVTDLLAQSDQVWGATAEAGLMHLDRASGVVEAIRREPGLLASNRLSGLALDRSGRLWVGTRGAGVSRRSADLVRWEVVNVLDGLPVDTVSVLEAEGDTVWIGTTQGIALWNGREIAGSLPDPNSVSFDTTFAIPSITGVVVLGDTLWLSTRRGVGFALLSTQLSDWRPQNSGLGVIDVARLASDGHSLFARAGTTVYRFRGDRWEPEAGPGVVRNLADDLGVVLVAGEAGLYRWSDPGWDLLPGSPSTLGPGDDPEPTVDPAGTVFAAGAAGIDEQPAAAGPWIRHEIPAGPPGNNLFQVAVQGPRVYVTTRGGGVGRLDGAGWRTWPPVPCSGADCDTTFVNPSEGLGLLVDVQGRKWVGCWSFALDSFDDSGSPPQFTHHVEGTDITTQRHTWVVSATADSSKGRWFGMDTPLKGDIDPIGLEYYDASGAYGGNFSTSNTNMSGVFVHALTTSANRRVWVGYDGNGLDFFVPPADSEAFIHLQSTNNLAIRALAAHGDSVWALTNRELLRFSQTSFSESTPASRIRLDGGQAQLGVKPLAVGPDGSVWAGTADGLRAFHPGGASEFFTTRNSPLTDDEVRCVAVDPGTGVVWIATGAGLNRYDPAYVPPAPPPTPRIRIQIFPNPATLTGLGIQLRLTGDASSYHGEIYDVSGRRLRRFVASANGQVIWDGRDESGDLVRPGIYLVRAEAGGHQAVARVALLH